MSDKNIKFGVLVDQTSLLQTQRYMQALTADFQKLAAAIQQASQGMAGILGGANVKAGAGSNPSMDIVSQAYKSGSSSGASPMGGKFNMAEMLSSQAGAFKSLAAAGKDSFGSIAAIISKTTDETRSKLDRLQSSLAATAAKYRELTDNAAGFASASRVGGIGGAAAYASRKGALGSEMRGLSGQISSTQKELGNLESMSPVNAQAQSSWIERQLSQGARAGVVGTLAMAGAAAVTDMVLAQPMMYGAAEARAGRGFGQFAVGQARGDLGQMAALRGILQDPNSKADFMQSANMGGWDYMGAGLGAIGGIFGGNFNVGKNFEDSMINMENSRKERLLAQISNKAQSDPTQQNRLQAFESMAATRLRQGWRFGLSDLGFSHLIGYKDAKGKAHGFGVYGEGNIQGALEAGRGYLGARGTVGGLGSVLEGFGSGMDMGAAAQMVGMGGVGGGNIMGGALGLKASGMDIVAAQALGVSTASMVAQNPYISGMGAMGAMGAFGFSGGALGIMEAQARAGSIGRLGTLTTGGDNYGQGTLAMEAIRVLGPNANVNNIQQLMTAASDKGLVAELRRSPNKLPPHLAQMGITAAQVVQASDNNSATQLKSRMVDLSGTSAQANFDRKLTGSFGGNIGLAFKASGMSAKAFSSFAATTLMEAYPQKYSGAMGQFQATQDVLTQLGDFSGHKAQMGRGGGARGIAASVAAGQALSGEQFFTGGRNEAETNKGAAYYENLKEISETIARIGTMSTSASEAASALDLLARTANLVADNGGDWSKARIAAGKQRADEAKAVQAKEQADTSAERKRIAERARAMSLQ